MEETEVCTKWWAKSRQIWINTITAIQGFIGYGVVEFKDTVGQNLDWIKSSGINVKYVYLIMGALGVVNIYLRYTAKTPLGTKKEAEKC